MKFLFLFLCLLLTYCAAPRTVIQSGKVTPKGTFRVGGNYSANISSETAKAMYKGVKSSMQEMLEEDSTTYDVSVQKNSKSLLAFSLDPVALGTDVYLRYGLPMGLDFGFKYAGGVFVYDVQGQLFGPDNNAWLLTKSKWYGNLGVQYSGQEYTLPSYLGDFQEFMGYKMDRKDIFIPFVTGKSFGKNEKYGAFGLGVGYHFSQITYEFKPSTVYEIVQDQYEVIEAVPQDSERYSSFGSFVNLKAGYKPIYVILALSIFYQNYGEYELLDNEKVSLSGWTFIPDIGLQVSF